VNRDQVNELVLQSLEHERGGVHIYETAITCVQNADLKQEWKKYLEQTRHHVEVLQNVCQELEIDPEAPSPGRHVVRKMGAALVQAMQSARAEAGPDAAELVACECVVIAETKDHLDWTLLGKCAEKMRGAPARTLQAACDEVEDEEDEHLYHSSGWCRELWLQSLGMKAVLPPPEERKHVKTAIGAARAEQASARRR
jgi:hypothetical protein